MISAVICAASMCHRRLGTRYDVLRGVAVILSLVFDVPLGSISSIWTSSLATGRRSSPFGTMYTSPGSSPRSK